MSIVAVDSTPLWAERSGRRYQYVHALERLKIVIFFSRRRTNTVMGATAASLRLGRAAIKILSYRSDSEHRKRLNGNKRPKCTSTLCFCSSWWRVFGVTTMPIRLPYHTRVIKITPPPPPRGTNFRTDFLKNMPYGGAHTTKTKMAAQGKILSTLFFFIPGYIEASLGVFALSPLLGEN